MGIKEDVVGFGICVGRTESSFNKSYPKGYPERMGWKKNQVRAQGLEPWTYGLKVPDEKTPKPVFDADKTGGKNQVSTSLKDCAQQKAQHFFDQTSYDKQEYVANDRGNQAKGSLDDLATKKQRNVNSNAAQAEKSIAYVSSQWRHLDPGIRDAILLLAQVGTVKEAGEAEAAES